ncbi:MAG: Rne/Rng family ribonuclease [Bacteroidales bacterium]|nr:Rne/Rng family ribonuclease [Bacteroidales bacterium]
MVRKELFIDAYEDEVKIALLEDKVLVELHKERDTDSFHVGDIFIGRVRRIISGLNAAFVDIGHEKDAFLHYVDLGIYHRSMQNYVKNTLSGHHKNASLVNMRLENPLPKDGNIKEVLSSGQLVLVQIAKESISTKGPRLTGEIAFAGRYLVLMPFADKVSVSQKIRGLDERNRLRKIVTSFRPRNMGIIVRTVAKGQSEEVLRKDLESLLCNWNEAVGNISGIKFPKRLIAELGRASTIMRDMLNNTFDTIYAGNKAIYDEILTYLKSISIDKGEIVRLHKGKMPLFEYYDIDKQIKSSFGKNVSIKGGIYLVIEHTEALHVIDINSGHRVSSDNTQEMNAVEVNLRAAVEVARQLRLRDMGGIIVVDFIDMRTAAHRKELYKCISVEMQKDKARHNILPPNKFGLVQITRQRVRPEVSIDVRECCPLCNGTGMISPTILVVDEIENSIQMLLQSQNISGLCISVHPFLYSYLKEKHYRWKWLFKYKKWITLHERTAFHLLEYKFFSKKTGEINFWTPKEKTLFFQESNTDEI